MIFILSWGIIRNKLLNIIKNSAETIYKMHYDIPRYVAEQAQLDQGRHPYIQKFRYGVSKAAMFSIGESHSMRKVVDVPSRQVNSFFKSNVLQPYSDSLLSIQKNCDRSSPIKSSHEEVRIDRRYGLRYLSMNAILNDHKVRAKFLNDHCGEIINQANKILYANLDNIFLQFGIDDSVRKRVLSMIPRYRNIGSDYNGDNKDLILSSAFGNKILAVIDSCSLEGKEIQGRVHDAFVVYDNIVKKSEKKVMPLIGRYLIWLRLKVNIHKR